MLKIRQLGIGLMFVLALLAVALPVQAQLTGGFISGTVTDQTSGVIAGAEITLTNQDTDVSQSIHSNNEGVYRFDGLPAGTYTLVFKAAKFDSRTVKNVVVNASQGQNINPGLGLSGTSNTIDINDIPGGGLVTTSATIQTTLPGKVLQETPMITTNLVPDGSRNDAKYALLAPGVARVNGQNQFSANGQRSRNSHNMIDGVDNNFITITFPEILVPPEAIGEFTVQTAGFSAEFGKHTGAQINVITRSGTKEFHGEAWEFYRGNRLEPLSLSNKVAGLTRTPRLVDNQFGGDVGGPAIKNKVFFFGLFQGNLQRQSPTAQTPITIPTSVGYATLQTVPLRTTPTAQSAASRQAVLNALGFLPAVYPTIKRFDSTAIQTVSGIPVEVGTFTPIIAKNQNLWYGTFRTDANLTSTDHLSYRFHIDHRTTPLASGNFVAGEKWAADTQYRAQNHALSYTKTVGSQFLNEARFAYTRVEPDTVDRDPVTAQISIGTLFKIGGSSSLPSQVWERAYQFQNVTTFNSGKHSIKFGIDIARITLFNNSAANSKGTWTFATLDDFLNNTNASLTQLVSAPLSYQFNQYKQGYFFQDDYKITRNLTVNLGMRYETENVPLGYFGVTDDQIQFARSQGATTAQTDILRALPGPAHRDSNNFGPRVGFAYSPYFSNGILNKILGEKRSVVRGGFGVIYDSSFYQLLGNSAGNYPRTNSQTHAALTDQFPTLDAKTAVPTLPTTTTTFVNIPANAQNPTTNYWSLSVQRQLSSHYVVEVGYLGNRSYHMWRQNQANEGIITQAKADAVIAGCLLLTSFTSSCQDPAGFPASPTSSGTSAGRLNPNFGSRILLSSDGEASYNAGYVQIDGRYFHGLQFGANYTWSANLSDSEEVFNEGGTDPTGIFPSSPNVPQNFLNRHQEWSRSVFDRPNRVSFHYAYEIPWFSSTPKAVRQVLGGWQLSGFTEIQSGQPFTIVIGVDALGNGTAASARPNLNPGGIFIMDPTTGNLRTFTIPKDGTGIVTAPHFTASTGTITFLQNSLPNGGNLGRNTFRGPGYSNTNLSLMKHIALPLDKKLEIRGDFINVFNHDNFQNPNSNMSSVNFGKQDRALLTDARLVQISLKLKF